MVDGYDVHLSESDDKLLFHITRDGKPVNNVAPLLGARGHLVALREGDLAYLHTHPTDDESGNVVGFETHFPSSGLYRLFFQFRVDGKIHTAEFTLQASA
jgi:hypothetical protein